MLFLAAALFVGSHACRDCHADIAEAYSRTPMARSSGAVESVPAAEFTASGQRYRISENRLFFDQGSAAFDYFVGSNSKGRTYLFQRDGYLFELPVTWYAHPGSWDASPGYEQYREVRLDRGVERSCLSCHASQVRYVRGTQNRYGDPPFAEGGVACERCHGPGSEHVQDPSGARMVNPAKLEAERRDSVCIQCHLTGVSAVVRAARSLADFRAGDKIADYATYFVWDGGPQDFKVTSHVERLWASGCKQAAGDKLWCGTCHEPHTNTDRTQAACQGCHQKAHHAEEQCASCHMPKAAAVDAGHGVFTDHSIPRDPRRPAPAKGKRELVAFLGLADDRAFGIAYAETGDPRARDRLLRARPADAQVLVRLGTLERNPERSASLYAAALREDPANTAALVNLGVLHAQAGRTGEAARLWRRALDTNPALEGAATNLSQILPAAEARTVLERYLSFNPGATAVRARLEALRQAVK
jgi:Cytochrome c554 and c-prime